MNSWFVRIRTSAVCGVCIFEIQGKITINIVVENSGKHNTFVNYLIETSHNHKHLKPEQHF